ncbi:hypothetical protein BSKO_06853 [Bryopsis sp. KO-2023]|nr:hypothetical protein BSKO_06853 [Bryopsis sp. KO-2023]
MTLVVAYLAAIGFTQSDSGGSGCEAVRAAVGVSARVILDSATLKELDNDVQSLVECMPAGAVLEFDLPDLVLGNSVELTSPITIEGNGASVQCPSDIKKGAFQIRSDDVVLSTLEFKGCFLFSTEGLIHVQNSKNVTLKNVEFEGNENVGGGPAGLSAIESEFTLLNVEGRSNTGSRGGVIAVLENSEASILDSNFTSNVALGSGGAVCSIDANFTTIMGSTFENNTARGQGSAVYDQVIVVQKKMEGKEIPCQ